MTNEINILTTQPTEINTSISGSQDIRVDINQDAEIKTVITSNADIVTVITPNPEIRVSIVEGAKGLDGKPLEYAWRGTELGVRVKGDSTYNYVDLRPIVYGGDGDTFRTENFIHDQITPQSIWVISHPLGKFPSVSVVDSAGSLVMGDVTYVDITTVLVSFSSAFSGRAYLN